MLLIYKYYVTCTIWINIEYNYSLVSDLSKLLNQGNLPSNLSRVIPSASGDSARRSSDIALAAIICLPDRNIFRIFFYFFFSTFPLLSTTIGYRNKSAHILTYLHNAAPAAAFRQGRLRRRHRSRQARCARTQHYYLVYYHSASPACALNFEAEERTRIYLHKYI